MALIVADRVQETTTTTGTGTYTLAGAKDGFQSFAAVGDGNTTYYACTDGTDYEVGIGTYTATGTTLARTTIIESSNSDLAVSWGAGSKDIFVTSPADKTLLVGRNLYVDNPNNGDAPSTATGTNSIAIGPLGTSTGINSVSIGSSADATGNQAYSFGVNSTASGLRSISWGSSSYTNNTDAVAIGPSAQAQSVGGLALGHDATVISGAQAVAIGDSRADGADSFAAAIGNNTSSYGATGANSIAIGRLSKASGADSFAIGDNNIVANTDAFALGNTNNVTGSTGIAIGTNHTVSGTLAACIGGSTSTASQTYAMTFGPYAKAAVQNAFIFGSKGWFSAGSAQGGIYILYADTTDATSEVLTTTNSTAASTNQIVAASDTCIMFSGTIVAMQNGAQDQGGWEIKGLLKNDGGTTTLVSSNIQTFADGNGWTVALSADNTNNALAITCTGEAAHNIRWVANISTSEVTYA
jgi:hypothetical protein